MSKTGFKECWLLGQNVNSYCDLSVLENEPADASVNGPHASSDSAAISSDEIEAKKAEHANAKRKATWRPKAPGDGAVMAVRSKPFLLLSHSHACSFTCSCFVMFLSNKPCCLVIGFVLVMFLTCSEACSAISTQYGGIQTAVCDSLRFYDVILVCSFQACSHGACFSSFWTGVLPLHPK